MTEPVGHSDMPDEPTISEVGKAWMDAHAAIAQRMHRFERFAEWVAGYESERQLVGSGVIDKAKKVLADG